MPTNETAINLAEKSTNRAKHISVRVDKTDPNEVFVVTSQGNWASFGITRGGESEIAGLTLDEEEVLASQTSLLWAKTEHESRVERVASMTPTSQSGGALVRPATKVSKKEQHNARSNETAAMKRALTEKQPNGKVKIAQNVASSPDDWVRIEEEERIRALDAIRKHRRKR
jgi:hypothetical protein